MQKKDKQTLYLGLDPRRFSPKYSLVHAPIIEILPLALERSTFIKALACSHILLTSRVAANLFFANLKKFDIPQSAVHKKSLIAVGGATASCLPHALCPKREQAEGVCELLDALQLAKSRIFYPHSRRSRTTIIDYLTKRKLCFTDLVLYDTCRRKDFVMPDLRDFDEVVFTSPSTVEAFFYDEPFVPAHLDVTTIGPITHAAFLQYQKNLVTR